MNRDVKSALVLGGTAAAAGMAYWFTGRSVNRGGLPVEKGTLTWSPQYEEGNPAKIRTPAGTELDIGSREAYVITYDLACKSADLLDKYVSLVERALSPQQVQQLHAGFMRDHRYPVKSVCTSAQKMLIADMVSAAVQFGQTLRLLAEMGEAADIVSAYCPSGRRDLAHLRFTGALNPLATHVNETSWTAGCLSTHTMSGWKAIGATIVRSWITAYFNTAQMPELRMGLAGLTEQDMEAGSGSSVAEPCMGLPVVVIPLIGKAIMWIIIGISVALSIRTIIRGAFAIASVNVDFLEMKRRQYEQALECAHDTSRSDAEREACRQELTETSEALESYNPGIASALRFGIIGAVVVGGLIAFNRLRKD